jgi:site-specific recombinase XerD
LLLHLKATYTPGTVGIYRKSLEHFVLVTGNIQLGAVTRRHIDAFTARRLQEISPVTVGIELRSLRAAFYTALRWELIEKNPFSGVKLPRTEEQIPKFLSRTDLTKLLAVMPHNWFRSMVILAVLTGLRRSELVNLTWFNVDFNHRVLHVQSQGTIRTKTGKRRIVPLNSTAESILRTRCQSRNGDYVFTPDGRQVHPHNVSRVFFKYVGKAGLDKSIHFHCLRHTFATWLVQDGVSIYHVQKLLGHSSVKVTEVYAHLAPEDLHHSVEGIQFELN